MQYIIAYAFIRSINSKDRLIDLIPSEVQCMLYTATVDNISGGCYGKKGHKYTFYLDALLYRL